MKTRKRMRLEHYDYSQNGFYFVTTNVGTKEYLLSNTVNSKVVLTAFGNIVKEAWADLPNHYSNCCLDEFVIMPDHIHGIIIIEKKSTELKQHGLSEIMRAFKSFSSKRINEIIGNGNKFKWHKSFYDRIIRDENELVNVRKYIRQNPVKWAGEYEK
jgi:REP-associated tyrosine transposase